MRSLTRVSVLMGPPWFGFPGGPPDETPDCEGNHTISKKALHVAGPKPTDHGSRRLRPAQNEYPWASATGPLNL